MVLNMTATALGLCSMYDDRNGGEIHTPTIVDKLVGPKNNVCDDYILEGLLAATASVMIDMID